MDDAARRFTTIYDEHYPKVLAYLLTQTHRQVAEDLAAETFTVAWRRLGSVPAEPLPWLLVVARNVLREQRRASGRQAALTGRLGAYSGREPGGGDLADAIVEGSEVRRALARLPERDRETLTLVAWLDLAPKDAAAVVGCAPATFLVRLHRARRRLERALRAARADPFPATARDHTEPVPFISTEESA